jgi:hypothetical protein
MTAIEIGVLVLAAIVMLGVVQSLKRWPGLPRAHARRPAPPTAPAELQRLEALAGGLLTEGDVDRDLRPLLHDIAAARLELAGVRLESEPERARELLGDRLWLLLQRQRQPSEDRFATVLSRRELEDLIDTLERL